MNDLIARYLAGDTTDLEARSVQRWRAESPENDRTFLELEWAWRMAGHAASAEVLQAPSVDTVTEPAEERRRVAETRLVRRAFIRSPWLAYGLSAAAAVAALAIALTRPEGTLAQPFLTPLDSSSRLADVITMGLSDGSVVRVAPASQIAFPSSRTSREVVLDGKAFFAVASGTVPFVVQTAVGEVTVHGTRFEVSAEKDRLRVVVVEGSVHVNGDAGEADLGPGQVAFLERGGVPRVIQRDDPWTLIDWSPEFLIFESTPLAEVGAELGRQFHRRVEVDPELQPLRIKAWFEGEPMDQVVSEICVIAGARCSVTETEIVIGREVAK